MRQARVAAIRALKPMAEISFVRFGTRAAVPPTNTAREAKWANPLSAYAASTAERGFFRPPVERSTARSWYDFTSVRTALSPISFDTSKASEGGTPIARVRG